MLKFEAQNRWARKTWHFQHKIWKKWRRKRWSAPRPCRAKSSTMRWVVNWTWSRYSRRCADSRLGVQPRPRRTTSRVRHSTRGHYQNTTQRAPMRKPSPSTNSATCLLGLSSTMPQTVISSTPWRWTFLNWILEKMALNIKANITANLTKKS